MKVLKLAQLFFHYNNNYHYHKNSIVHLSSSTPDKLQELTGDTKT